MQYQVKFNQLILSVCLKFTLKTKDKLSISDDELMLQKIVITDIGVT